MPVDPSASIAPTARIHPNARIGPRTVVRDYCVIEDDVVIGADCLLEPYVFVKRWTTLGDGNQISAGTALGTDPLDKNFTGERSYLIIGNRNRIREHYTISRGTQPESKTVIGDDNYIMTSGHIALLAIMSFVFIFTELMGAAGGMGVGMLFSLPLAVGVSGLEIIVVLVQAYVFTLLSAVFIGMAIHVHH